MCKKSNIRHKDFRWFVQSDFVCNAHATPPWILKRGGLESSGRILISSNGKTKRIAFFCLAKQKKKQKSTFSDFLKKKK